MRITPLDISRNFLSDMGTLNQDLAEVNRQISSGKKLNQLADSPSGSAELVSLGKLEAENDQYTFNSNASSLYLKVADSSLNDVNNLITSIYTRGSQAATDGVTADSRAAIAEEVRSLRDQIVSLANSQVNGRYLFAGSAISQTAFSTSGDAITYNGDDTVSSIGVSAGVDIPMSFAGNEVFDSAFAAVNSLLAGIDSNDISSINAALSEFSTVLSGLSRIRADVGTNMGVLENIQARLDSQDTILTEQRSQIEDADSVQAAVQLSQMQSGLEAAMSAGATILQQRNLFDILG